MIKVEALLGSGQGKAEREGSSLESHGSSDPDLSGERFGAASGRPVRNLGKGR